MDDREKLVLALRGLQARSKLHVFLFAPGLIVLGAVLLVSAYEFNHLHDALTMKEGEIASLNAEAKASKALGASMANARADLEAKVRADLEACLAEFNTELNKPKEGLIKERDTAIKERDTANANALDAEGAKRRAEDNEKIAQRAQKDALAALDDTSKANRELQRLLDKEHKRVIELENAIGSKPINDLAK